MKRLVALPCLAIPGIIANLAAADVTAGITRSVAGPAAALGGPRFRRALRDPVEQAKGVAATAGVFAYLPTAQVGRGARARVLTRIEMSNWKLLSGHRLVLR